MTIQLPEDLATHLAEIAAAQNTSVEQLAVERLRSFGAPATSPQALAAILRNSPHPSAAAVDQLEAAIAANHLPVQQEGPFDR